MRTAVTVGSNKMGVAVHLEGYEYLPEATSVTEVSAYERTSNSAAERENQEAGASAHTFNFRPVAV
jgi:hypothetical protein